MPVVRPAAALTVFLALAGAGPAPEDRAGATIAGGAFTQLPPSDLIGGPAGLAGDLAENKAAKPGYCCTGRPYWQPSPNRRDGLPIDPSRPELGYRDGGHVPPTSSQRPGPYREAPQRAPWRSSWHRSR